MTESLPPLSPAHVGVETLDDLSVYIVFYRDQVAKASGTGASMGHDPSAIAPMGAPATGRWFDHRVVDPVLDSFRRAERAAGPISNSIGGTTRAIIGGLQ